MKKIIVKAPALSRSGYGEQARFALRALASRPDLFDVYLINIPWGATGMIVGDTEERRALDTLINKTAGYMGEHGPHFDVSLQITIPLEFEEMAPVNIGYTAGIETRAVAPEWVVQCNKMVDKIITISEHSQNTFIDAVYEQANPSTGDRTELAIKVPVDVVNYPVRHYDPEPVDISFETERNFLVVSQWGPRKNLDNTLKWFVETFKDDETVGLVLKTNLASDSLLDRERCATHLERRLKELGERKCKIYLVHGSLTPNQLTWLYQHPTMKALVNIGHGEGYGLPLFEAAYNGLPLITIPWSGHMDFICRTNKKGKRVPLVAKVEYELRQVQPEAVWDHVIPAESMWAFPKANSFRRALKEVLNKEGHYRNQAKNLQAQILSTYTTEKLYADFVQSVQSTFGAGSSLSEGASNVVRL